MCFGKGVRKGGVRINLTGDRGQGGNLGTRAGGGHQGKTRGPEGATEITGTGQLSAVAIACSQ